MGRAVMVASPERCVRRSANRILFPSDNVRVSEDAFILV
jgi:hypothetical protein